MAVTSGRIYTAYANYTAFYVAWQRTGYSVAGNYTDIAWQAGVHSSGATPTWYSNAIRIDDGNVNGTALGNGTWSNITIPNGTDVQLRNGTLRLYHDGAGNKSFGTYINGWLYANGNKIASGSYVLPSLATLAGVTSTGVSNLSINSVTGNGNVTFSGNQTVTSRGIAYGTGVNPTTAGSKVASGSGTGSFSASLTGLSPNTTYHYRAYAINGSGTSYGGDIAFTTQELPVVSISTISAIAGTTATANGSLTNNGNPDITEKGFVYSTSPTPTTVNTKFVVSGSATGVYSGNLTGLTPSTTYYIRAYAINSAGTVYSTELSFSTVVAPTLTTSAATSVSTTQATGNGNVTSDGGGTITERGFVYGTSASPTTAGSKKVSTGTTGAYSDTITGLTPSVTYYYRSYAINEGGTAYGNELTFSTAETNPLQPSLLAPAGGIATDDLTPDLSWQYNPGSANDDQSAYQIIVTRQVDSVVMWDSGKVISSAKLATYAGTALSYNVDYQWKVRVYNQSDLVSPYASTVLFKTSVRPVATITFPTDASTIASNTPTVTWTYSDTETTAQVNYRLRIYSVSSELLHDSGETVGTATSYIVPDGILENVTSYSVTVELEDGDGLKSNLASNTFTVQFLAPASPSIVTTVDAAGIVDVNVTINKPPLDGWFADTITLHKRQFGSLTFDVIEADIPVTTNLLDNGDPANWTQSSVGTIPTSATAKYGVESLGLGASGIGDAVYEKTVSVTNLDIYDTMQAFINVVDISKFTSIDIQFGDDSSNYYYVSIASGDISQGQWNPMHVSRANWSTVGNPSLTDVAMLRVVVKNASGVITAGDVKIDQIRMLDSSFTYKDYDTANSTSLIYGVSAYSNEALVSTGVIESAINDIEFTEQRINTYIVPIGDEQLMVRSWQDGSTVAGHTDTTETQYYNTLGSKKPTVFVNANQAYKQGSIELWFFDDRFGGQGLVGTEILESIKNFKPLLLRTWYGRNYRVSIDGVISVARKQGIAWVATFAYTEIE